jgi:peptidoglycan/LPS O-acetylase OafA/YrhL
VGLVLGIAGSFLYLGVRRWLPERQLLRALWFALVILGLGLTATINGNEGDFEFVNTVVSVAAFACVLLAYGVLVPTLLDRLAPRRASRSRWGRGLVGVVLGVSVLSGALAVRRAFEIADGTLLG